MDTESHMEAANPNVDNGGDSIIKAVILIGGPQKGTRFRPLSLDVPKPLFPLAGVPLLQHLIERCVAVPALKEILILGYFPSDDINPFLTEIGPKYKSVRIRYLQEYTRLGTAGGIFHFRDQIKLGNPSCFVVINGDVSGDFPLREILEFHQDSTNKPVKPLVTMLATEATRQQSVTYGCIVEDKTSHQVVHFVEKPSTFVSTLINCGVYICGTDIFQVISKIRKNRQQSSYMIEAPEQMECIMIERDIIMPCAGKNSSIYVFQTSRVWSQVKTAASAIYANKQYLELYRRIHPCRLAQNSKGGGGEGPSVKIIGDVYIHPTAQLHPTCVIGPNVSIGKNVVIGPGVRIRDSIILGDSTVEDHTLILYTIVGWSGSIGKWSRIEGTPSDPNPNKPFAKMENVPLFNLDGRLNPSITVLGCHVRVPSEVVVLNSIVLPHKELTRSFANEIIL